MSLRDQLLESLGCEYQKIGPFRLRKYGQLLGNEAEFTEIREREATRLTMQIYALAHDAATASGQDPAPLLELLDRASKNQQEVSAQQWQELFGPYFSQLVSLQTAVPIQATVRKEAVHMMLMSRGEFQPPEDGPDAPWQKLKDREDWTEETSASLPGDILEGLWSFYQLELKGWPKTKGAAGKPPAAATKRRRARGLSPSPS